jgi:hypothetical protein
MKTCGGVGVQIQVSLTLALLRGEWSASQPSRFTSTHWIGGGVGPRASLDDMEK